MSVGDHSELLQVLVQTVDPDLAAEGDGIVVDAILSIDTTRPSLKPLYRAALQVTVPVRVQRELQRIPIAVWWRGGGGRNDIELAPLVDMRSENLVEANKHGGGMYVLLSQTSAVVMGGALALLACLLVDGGDPWHSGVEQRASSKWLSSCHGFRRLPACLPSGWLG